MYLFSMWTGSYENRKLFSMVRLSFNIYTFTCPLWCSPACSTSSWAQSHRRPIPVEEQQTRRWRESRWCCWLWQMWSRKASVLHSVNFLTEKSDLVLLSFKLNLVLVLFWESKCFYFKLTKYHKVIADKI